MPKFGSRQLLVVFRSFLSWRVGSPGLDRSAFKAPGGGMFWSTDFRFLLLKSS